MTRNWSNQNQNPAASKQKRGITKITNSQNTKRTYGQPNEQLFPKRWQLSNLNRTENNLYVNIRLNIAETDTKKGNRGLQ